MLKQLLILIVFLPNIFFGQHTIKGVFTPAKDFTFALLYKVTPTISEYITSADIEEDGSFQIKLDSTITKGIYRLVYAIPQEDNNFDIIYNKKENIELLFNSETGVEFKSSSENKLLASYYNSMSTITYNISKYFKEENKNTSALTSIFKKQRKTQDKFETLAKGTTALEFIKANKPYIPNRFENMTSYISNVKKHYFDAIDFNNKTLQSSSFINERLTNYIFGITNAELDELTNYKNNIDTVSNVIKELPNAIKRILFLDLWEQMAGLNHDGVANYISDKYLITIAKNLNDTKLVKELTLYKNISIGNKAPDFSFEFIENEKRTLKNLSDLEVAKNYIIVFWSSACSHCLNEIPKLHALTENQEKNNIKVIAVGLEDEPYNWKNLTYSYPNFIHVYGEGKWDNNIGNSYGIKSTPTYFLLDKDKKIISKPENFEALKKVIANL